MCCLTIKMFEIWEKLMFYHEKLVFIKVLNFEVNISLLLHIILLCYVKSNLFY